MLSLLTYIFKIEVFFFSFIFISWRLITLQYCSGFCHAFESVLMRWMKLDPIIQSEVSQKDKDQYSILMHIYMEFRKMVKIEVKLSNFSTQRVN